VKRAADADVKRALDAVRAACDVADRRSRDPVGVVHRYASAEDQELVALVAACIAFGNVKTIRAKLDDALDRLGPHPARAADDERGVHARMNGWIHRVFRGEDIARLLVGARRVQKKSGSLGAHFAGALAATGTLRDALAAWCDAIREAGGLAREIERRERRGPAHLLPDPRGASGSKRLFLYLRWMVRTADGVDLGLWTAQVSPRVLLCPVDTHIHKLARNLGLTARTDLSWRTTEEITRGLARLDAEDPVKYDFSLCHLGMLQRCPSRRDPARCEGCGVLPVCRHWQSARGKREAGRGDASNPAAVSRAVR
jgi:uncharacterized protein (TIGR02757 family)